MGSLPEWGSRMGNKSPLPPALQQFGSLPEWGLRQQSLQAGLQSQLQQLHSQQHSTASNTANLMQVWTLPSFVIFARSCV